MTKSVDDYLSKGFDRQTAEYFAAGKKTLVGVSANDDFTLTLRFDDGERRLYDMRPYLKKGTVFEPLACRETFRRVYVDDANAVAWDIDPTIDSNTVWSNKIDLCPEACYIDSVPLSDAPRA